MKTHALSLVAALLIAPLTAQSPSYYIPSNTPSTGTCNVIPFGDSSTTWTNQKYQTIITAADLGNAAVLNICDLAWAPCGGGGAANMNFQAIEIVMAQTTLTTLSTTFSANLGSNVQTVLSAKDYDWNLEDADNWNRIGLDKPYLYIAAQGANIVVQVTLAGASRSGTGLGFHRDALVQRVYAFSYTGTPPAVASGTDMAALKMEVLATAADVSAFGRGCLGSNNLTPQLTFTGTGKVGTALGINLANALPNANAFLSVNLSRNEPALDLSLIGAPGCLFYVTNLIALGVSADSSGNFSLSTTLPASTPLCLRAYFQYLPIDAAANAAGLTSSNYGRLLTGN
ncbi:MAG: hypothetical protein KDC87_08890 [Planctomycetes bacterium]|nr:hypothetical protein [Planctomycetota bacterium]MCB9870210.1 hypothetical protein [Planctomycetota bacterium]MCB9888210.1 hypothetical protein [Planctomycetota bacterium]